MKTNVDVHSELALVQIPVLLLTKMMPLSKFPSPSDSQFSHLQNGIRISTPTSENFCEDSVREDIVNGGYFFFPRTPLLITAHLLLPQFSTYLHRDVCY